MFKNAGQAFLLLHGLLYRLHLSCLWWLYSVQHGGEGYACYDENHFKKHETCTHAARRCLTFTWTSSVTEWAAKMYWNVKCVQTSESNPHAASAARPTRCSCTRQVPPFIRLFEPDHPAAWAVSPRGQILPLSLLIPLAGGQLPPRVAEAGSAVPSPDPACSPID